MNLDAFDYQITGEEIMKKSWEEFPEKVIAKALRELQQKRLMEDPKVKKMKNSCKIEEKNYHCPVCNISGHDSLQAAHVGTNIKTSINSIVEQYSDKLSYNLNKLIKMVIEEENNSIIQICCRKCNKDLEIL